MLNYYSLYYLVEIAKCGSLTLAAEELNLTRSALSTSMKNLENDLGLQLLVRSKNGVTLTKEGELVTDYAQKGFQFFDKIKHIKKSEQQKINNFTIYSYASLFQSKLVNILTNYSMQLENVEITPQLIQRESIETILEKNSEAFVLGYFNEMKIFDDYVVKHVIHKCYSCLMVSNDAPYIALNTTSILFKDLINIPLIVSSLNEEYSFQYDILESLKKYGIPNIVLNMPVLTSIQTLVRQNKGAYICPNYLNSNISLTEQNLRLINIKNAPKYSLCILHHKNVSDEKVELILNFLKTSFS